MKCLQGLYFNFMVWSWKSMKLTPHIAIRDPKTGMSRQEWFGPFFFFIIFNSFSFTPTATPLCALWSAWLQGDKSSCLYPYSQHKCISLENLTILKKNNSPQPDFFYQLDLRRQTGGQGSFQATPSETVGINTFYQCTRELLLLCL